MPPRIISRVIQVAAEPSSTAVELARLISKDPTLTTQVLRAVNSAYYGLRRRIDTVHHGVAFMGMSAVRNLVLCIGVQQLVHREDVGDFPLEQFWEGSVRRAASAACLARRLGLPQPDEFFTLGLCQDIGVLALLREDAALRARYAACLGEPAAFRLEVEREFGETHEEVGAQLLRLWKLPDDITASVRFHHRPDEAPEAVRGRCLIAQAAESVADLLQVRNKAAALEQAQQRLEGLHLSPALLHAIVEEVADDVFEAAEMLQLQVGNQPSYEEIVAKASDALLSLSLSQAGTLDTESERNEQQRRTLELQQRNEELARQAATDSLTGLANRRMFDEAVVRELAQADRQKSQVSILLLDIDHFKELNDTYGHLAGDRVLAGVAAAVRQMVRRSDLCARYGGEEFGVVLPFTDEAGGRVVAERMRSAVQELVVDWEGDRLTVAVSIGGVTVRGSGRGRTAASVVRAADDALYRAKHQGRDRVCWACGPR